MPSVLRPKVEETVFLEHLTLVVFGEFQAGHRVV